MENNGTILTPASIILMLAELQKSEFTGKPIMIYIPDKLPLFHVRLPRKLKKKLKK